MKLFKDLSLKWWQIPIVKICLISLGIIIGTYFNYYLSGWLNVFWLLFAATSVYFIYIWWGQRQD